MLLKKILKYIKYPPKIILKLDNLGLFHLDDEKYLKIRFKDSMGKDLN